MNYDENIFNTPQKNKNKHFNTYKISPLKYKTNQNVIAFTQVKNLRKNILLKDSSFKVGNYKNNEKYKTQLILYNTNSNKTNKKKLSKIISSSDEMKKLTKSKSKLIQKTKIHKKDFGLAERLFLSSRYAFSNFNNYENENEIDNKQHNLFKLTKDISCPKINNLKYQFHIEKENNINNIEINESHGFNEKNTEKNENKNNKTLKNVKIISKTEINDKDNLNKKNINKTYNIERNEIENKEKENIKKEKFSLNQLKEIGKNKKSIVKTIEKKEKQIEKKKENIENLLSINFKTIEISDSDKNNNENDENKIENDNKEYLLINKFTEKRLNKNFSSRILIESINHSNSKKSLSNVSFDILNQIKKNDIINPEEQHFICVNFQQNLKIMNTLIN